MTHTDIEPQISDFSHHLPALEPIPPVDIARLLRTLWHGKWIIAFTTMICVVIAGYYAFRVAQPQFQAVASVAQISATNDDALAQSPPVDAEVAFNTELASLTSRGMLVQVIAELNLLSDNEFNRYLNPQSPYSMTVLRNQLRHFLAGTTDIAPTGDAVFEKTIDNLRRAITTRQQGDTYVAQITVRSGSAEKATLIANTLAQIYLTNKHDASLLILAETTTWLEEKTTALGLQLSTQETQISHLIAAAQIQENAGLDALSRQVLTAEQNLAQARSALDAITPAQETGNTRIAATLAQKRLEHDAIALNLDRLRAQLTAQSSGLATLHQFQVEAEATKIAYMSHLTRLQDMRSQQDRALPYATTIAPAMRGHYIGPQKVLILTIATALGLLVGLVIVALRQTLRSGIFDASELRHATGLPIFAQFSNRLPTNPRGLKRVLGDNQPSAITEVLKGLCASLIVSTQGRLPKVILSTSSTDRECKGLPAILLANYLGRSGKTVLFIAADQTDRTTFSFLCGSKEASSDNTNIQTTRNEVLRADVLLAWDNDWPLQMPLETHLIGLRDRYDHIIIEAPPVTAKPEAVLWAQQADAIIYSVSCGGPSMTVINRGLRALRSTGTPIAGLVFTQISPRQLRQSDHGNFITPIAAKL